MTRRVIGWALRLYPRAWRERYGDEFLATVEDMPAPGWAAVWDVWRGAMAMQVYNNGQRFLRLATIFGLVGLVLAGSVSLWIPDEFLSTALIGARNVDNEAVSQSVRRVLTRQQLLALVEKHGLYAEERTRLPLEDIYERMKKSVRVSTLQGNDPGKRTFTLGFRYDNGPVAQKVANDLVAALMDDRLSPFMRLDAAPDPAPIYPNRPVFAFTGLLGGVLAGLAWGLVSMLVRRRA